MKIITVVGARPQFVKAASVSRVLRTCFDEILVHTGQHYDVNMSDIFFNELDIPKPEYYLGVGGGTHAVQTAQMLIKIEEVLIREKPDLLLVYGDTNSTLAGALAACKIHIPVIHIEAGLRSFNKDMPEEINRVLTDRVSDYLFCPTNTAVKNLAHEGMTKNVYQVGDVMCDAVKFYSQKILENDADFFLNQLNFYFSESDLNKWYLATLHRADTADDINAIESILSAFEELDSKVVFPVHPRTFHAVEKLNQLHSYKNIVFIKPVGYLTMLFLIKNAKKVVTDSGGLQKEAYMLGTDCVTLRGQTEWVETLEGNFNVLSPPPHKKEGILNKILNTKTVGMRKPYYGDGHTAEKIVEILRGLL